MKTASRIAVLVLPLLLACASTDPRPAFEQVSRQVEDRSGLAPAWPRTSPEEDAAEQAASEVLASPLDANSAARVALLRNRALLADVEELGIAQADYAQATRIANPTLSAFRRTPSSGSGLNVEIELVEDLLDVLVQPARKRIAAVELEAAKLRLGQTLLDLVAETKSHFFEYVAAEQAADRLELVRQLSAAAAELARRQRDAGNLEEREVALFEASEAEATIDLTRARLEAGMAREKLNVLLGSTGAETTWSAVRRLAPLPTTEASLERLESLAIERRLDLAAARFGVDVVGRALALKRGTRYLPIGVEVGLNRERELDGLRLSGPQISIALPLFDTGAASIARLEAELRRSQRQLEQIAIEIRSEVRLARDEVLGTRAVAAAYQSVLVPKRTVVLEQTLLHYNMMLLGVYDLLQARREETEAEVEGIRALRDYWVARTRLERAVGSRLAEPGDAAASASVQESTEATGHEPAPTEPPGDER